MWNTTLANFKENLYKIAQDVHDDDDEDDGEEEEEQSIYDSHDRLLDSPISNRRFSRNSDRSASFSNSPLSNGIDLARNSEIEQYKAEIKKLQESEAEIKALSVNYAALLKEKEDYISRLSEENGTLKQNMANNDHSPRLQKAIVRTRSIGSPTINGTASKQDGFSNGVSHSKPAGVNQSKTESRHSSIQGNEKELALLEERNRSLASKQSSQELQIKQLGMELDKERAKLADINRKLQDEQKMNATFQDKLNSLKVDKDKTCAEMNNIRDDLNQKSSEIRRLQTELSRRGNAEANDVVESLKRTIATLEKENINLKREKEELYAAVKASAEKVLHGGSGTSDKLSNSENESSGAFPGKEEMESSLRKLENDLKESCREKEKTLQQLNRLKQHLLDKESEDSEKMDEDSKIIEQLRVQNEYQRSQILRLEKALKQTIASQEEVKLLNNEELQKSKEIIEDLNKKVSSCLSTIDAKNIELLNLQTALGQYYAEIETKEHLEGAVALAREESARLSEKLKDAYQQAEMSRRDKEETLAKLSDAEKMIAEGKARVNKIEEDNAKLRRALEQSMTSLNRMSMDSDYFVDRRIVIKLLVTYFQRNHSKEVLDLMVRMLGFSDEDKQKIGVAQQGAAKGVVRGVLGLPGRFVGGILGGSTSNGSASTGSDNQSFADLWVDFLLKETKERERRESADAMNESKRDQSGASPNITGLASPMSAANSSPAASTSFSRFSPPFNQRQSLLPVHGNLLQPGHSDSEFSTVSLTSSESNSQISRMLPRY